MTNNGDRCHGHCVSNSCAAKQSCQQPRDGAAPAAPSLAGLLGPTSLSGFVDLYYSQNFNNPASQTNGLRFFDQSTQMFGLNMVELVVDKTPEVTNSRTGYHVALGFGQAMNAVNSHRSRRLGLRSIPERSLLLLSRARREGPAGGHRQVRDAGRSRSHRDQGQLELLARPAFSYAIPYYHFGMRAKYAFNDKYALTGFFMNGWNNVVDNNTGKTYGVSFAWNPNKKFGVTENYMAGPEQNNLNSDWRQLSDTVITYSPTSKLSFIVNGDYGRGDRITDPVTALVSPPVFWTGVAGYVRYAFNATSAISTRYEYYDDPTGFTTGTTATSQRVHCHCGAVSGTPHHQPDSNFVTTSPISLFSSKAPHQC